MELKKPSAVIEASASCLRFWFKGLIALLLKRAQPAALRQHFH